jgi:hypothetical protein
MRAIPLFVASSVFALGCNSCPTIQGIKQDRTVTGRLTYQLAGADPTTGDIGPLGSFVLPRDGSGTYTGEVDFGLAPDEPSPVTGRPAFAARLVVHVAPGGASETDLSDDNAILTVSLSGAPPIAYHGVSGHLSLRGIDWTCQFLCLVRASGTLTVSAAGPNQEVFALSSATLVAADSEDDTQICQG